MASGQPSWNVKQGQRKTTGQSLGTSGHQVEKELEIVGGQEEQTSTDNRSAKLTASSYQRSEKVTADDGSQQVCSDAQGSITDKVASLQASGSSNLSLQTQESPVNGEWIQNISVLNSTYQCEVPTFSISSKVCGATC